ncbi:MAG: hypothetical protein KF745_02475 [Phycisphaeraceae bacterium]|nr:hypothetical protein [Phycisphaeraceae bacterium]
MDGRVVEFSDAPQAILLAARGAISARAGAVLIGISGAVCSGKSTLARRLSGCIISTDDYLPDYETVEFTERDLPERSDLDRLCLDLQRLRTTGETATPIWSFKTHRREGDRIVTADRGTAVCEGIHALHTQLSPLYHVRVFVEASRDERWRRCLARELAGERGWSSEHAREHFEAVAEPTFDRFATDYRSRAHLIVMNQDPETM